MLCCFVLCFWACAWLINKQTNKEEKNNLNLELNWVFFVGTTILILIKFCGSYNIFMSCVYLLYIYT